MSNGSNSSTLALLACTQVDPGTIERVNYFPRQLLTADDMFADQDYFRLKLKRHNLYLHGWGTVCGLVVTPVPTQAAPWLVQISVGYALGPYGDEIYVGDPVSLDLSTCGPSGAAGPCDPGTSAAGSTPAVGATVYIGIEYAECMSRPISVTPAGCGCEQTSCQNSRIRDSFVVQCLATLPSSYQAPPSTGTMCDFLNNQEVPACPACPSDPWVVLAAVSLPSSSSTAIADANIDNYTLRRQIFSVAVLQNQVAECCCAPPPTPTPTPTPTPPPPPLTTVTSISFTPGQQFINLGPNPIQVTFSQPVLVASVTSSTFFVTGSEGNADGAITYDSPFNPTTLSATFTASSALLDTNYTVTLAGNGPSPITDINNVALDGNADGVAGGNYTANFSVIQVIQ